VSLAISVSSDEPLEYARGLTEATCAIAASADRDSEATIEALVEQLRRRLPVEVVVLLLEPGTGRLVEGCPGGPLRPACAQDGEEGSAIDALARAAIARGGARPVADRPGGLTVPLVAGDEMLGAAHLRWIDGRAPSPLDVELVDALARHAGLAIGAARRRAAATSVRAQSEAVSAALSDAVLIFDPDGALIEANRPGREWIRLAAGDAPATARSLRLAAGAPARPGQEAPARLVDRALAGQSAADELIWTPPDGSERRLHLVATPVRDRDGAVRAAAVIARDVTDFHRAVSARARFEGAVKTARRISHELGNQLAPVLGYAEILANQLKGEEAEFAGRIVDAALEAASTLGRLQRIIRFEQTEFGGEVMLDLDAATTERPRPA
jgi:PAS domain-containing protein